MPSFALQAIPELATDVQAIERWVQRLHESVTTEKQKAYKLRGHEMGAVLASLERQNLRGRNMGGRWKKKAAKDTTQLKAEIETMHLAQEKVEERHKKQLLEQEDAFKRHAEALAADGDFGLFSTYYIIDITYPFSCK